jgi:hypothetical protein
MIKRKRFTQLLRDPWAGRVAGDIAVQNTPSIMRNYEEAVQDLEGERWHGEEVHCGDGFAMILQEDLPALCLTLGQVG